MGGGGCCTHHNIVDKPANHSVRLFKTALREDLGRGELASARRDEVG